MKRIRWVLIALGVLAVAAVVAWGFWSSRPTPSVDRKVIDAYTQKGATYGELRVQSGDPPFLDFLPRDPGHGVAPSSVPAFRFPRFDGVRADELPAVGRPFGIDLNNGRVSDAALGEVAKFDQLTWLNLTATPITDGGLEHLAGMTGLTHLSLMATAVTDDGTSYLAKLTNLVYLNLAETKVTGRGAARLAALPNLSYFKIYGDQISDDVLAALAANKKFHALTPRAWGRGGRQPADSEILNLWLDGTQVTDAGLKHVASLTNLSSLNLPSNLTDDGLKHLTPLTKLRELDLRHTKVTDAGMATLADHPSLASLTISETTVTVEGVKRLISSKSLKGLYLADAQITDEMLAVLVLAGKLHLLHQAEGKLVPGSTVGEGTNQKSSGPSRLGTPTDADIRLLRLSNTRVTDAGLEHLAGLTDLEEIDLTGTTVTAEGKKRFREKFPKCRVLP